jgi:hypothetical protein
MAARVERERIVVDFSLPGRLDRSFARPYLSSDGQRLSGEAHLNGGDISSHDQIYLAIRLDRIPLPELKPDQVQAQPALAASVAALPGYWHAGADGRPDLDHVLVVDRVQVQSGGWRIEVRSAPSGCPPEPAVARLVEFPREVLGLEVRERGGDLVLLQVWPPPSDAQSDLLRGRRVEANGVMREIQFERAKSP